MSGVGTQPLKIGCLAVRANVLSLVVLSSFSLCLVALSYQLAGLVALVLVLHAASYGIIKELKFKGVELSFCSQKRKDGSS